jgi:uncharacterized protein (TIGR02284 family)
VRDNFGRLFVIEQKRSQSRLRCVHEQRNQSNATGALDVNHAVSLSMLKDLIATSKDGERGFALAAKDNQEPGVADLLKDGEESCRVAVSELQDQVLLLGGATDESGTVKALAYRGWINFNAVPISRDTKLILEECERGEDYARSRYEAAMKLELPESARVIVERQYQRVIDIHGRLRLLRNRYPASEIPRAAGSRSDNR